MQCPECEGSTIKWGKTRDGHQRYRCKACDLTTSETPENPLAPMRIGMDRAVLVLGLLTEGMSIRAAERITGHHRDTICKLLVLAGQRCESLLSRTVQDVEVSDVEADEIWGFVGMKQKTKNWKGLDASELGDAYTFVGMEATSKLVLAWELGKRTIQTTDAFIEKLDGATTGSFQLTTDGFNAYPESVNYHLGTRVDHGVLIKQYGTEGTEQERRYSPPSIIGVEKIAAGGNPDPERMCTSYVERQNLTMRMQNRRLTRLTNAFSKKWENLRASLALHFATYNFVRRHSTLRMTPAMKAGLTNRFWGIEDLLTA